VIPIPNYATNYAAIVGEREQIDALIAGAIVPGTDGGAATLDFDKIIPMPAELRDTVSPVKIVDTDVEAERINTAHVSTVLVADDTHQGKQTRAITRAQAEQREATYGRTGLGPVLTWYEWATKNWGTKWNVMNASSFQRTDAGRLNLVFTTAWSMPTPIFAALENTYGVTVHARTMVEGSFEDESYGDPEDYIDETRTLDFY
jgi:hypothetical protein